MKYKVDKVEGQWYYCSFFNRPIVNQLFHASKMILKQTTAILKLNSTDNVNKTNTIKTFNITLIKSSVYSKTNFKYKNIVNEIILNLRLHDLAASCIDYRSVFNNEQNF